tara:strand:+ start:1482 stop:4940 length:3459 start_codon:yes stop_codon:yes gene_type:complete
MGLNSTSTIKIIDLLCEGTIEGIVGGEKGIYLDETPVKAEDDSNNFEEGAIGWDFRLGGRTQDKLSGYIDAETSNITNVNTEIGSNYSETINDENEVDSRDYGAGTIVRQISDTSIDSFQLIFTIPALFSTAQEGLAKGQLFNAKVRVVAYVQSQGSAYNQFYSKTIEGISTTDYQIKTPIIELEGNGPWNIKIDKVTSEEDDYEISYTQFQKVSEKTPLATSRGNRIFWTNLIERKELRNAYPYTACVGLNVSTEAFDSLPTRSYLIKGLKIETPHNSYSRDDGSLSFDNAIAFDGSLDVKFTTCPVCVFYAMATNKVYGAGDYISSDNLNWVDLYPLCEYANQLITNPDGTTEPRFAINTVIGSQNDAYSVLRDLASVFRGMTYWSSNTIQLTADHGELDGSSVRSVHLYNNSNVIDGLFNYSGTSLRTRSTSIKIRYNDPENLYKENFVVVEDYNLITKYGYQSKEIKAFGCSSKWQAQRLGRWMITAEELDQEVISFSTGLEGVAVFPGQVFSVADDMRQGSRVAGRVASATATEVTCDQSITLPSGSDPTMRIIHPDGTTETKLISSVSGAVVTLSSALAAVPQAQSVWSISSSSVEEQQFRCLKIEEKGDGTYTITATEFNNSIYATADAGEELEYKDISLFNENPSKPTKLVHLFNEIRQNNNTVNRNIFTWARGTNGASVKYGIRYKQGSGSYETGQTSNTSWNIDGLESGVSFTFEVRAIGPEPLNKKSSWTTISIKVPSPSSEGGTEGPANPSVPVVLPPDPINVSIQSSSKDEVTFRWGIPGSYGGNTSDLISIVRHSSKTDGTGTWADSTLLREVQANTDSVVLDLIEGEYMVKFKDKNDNKSANETSAIISLPDALPRLDQTTRREDTDVPAFQGEKNKVFYSDEYDALVLDGSDLWDDQEEDIDTWATIDFFGPLQTTGTYYFNNIVDLGGVFTAVFKRKLTTRGLIPNDTIDDRATDIDRWSDFDGALADETTANIYFRTSNNAPADEDIITEDGDKLLLEDGSDILQESSQDYGVWTPMESGRYTGRVFQFKVDLSSTTSDQTPLVDELGYTLQFENRTESSSMDSGAGAKVVTYAKAFYQTPKLGITANNMATGDYYEISSESRTGFTVHFKNSSGSSQNRSFSYLANGYGAEGS